MSKPAATTDHAECASCGVDGLHFANDFCHGCGETICCTCVLVFEHEGNGEHGHGDPADRVREWRAAIRTPAPPPSAPPENAAGDWQREASRLLLALVQHVHSPALGPLDIKAVDLRPIERAAKGGKDA